MDNKYLDIEGLEYFWGKLKEHFATVSVNKSGTSTSDINYITVDGTEYHIIGAKGDTGDTGASALYLYRNFIDVREVGATVIINNHDFSRIPIIGDAVINADSGGNLCLWKVIALTSDGATIELKNILSLRGPKGDAGMNKAEIEACVQSYMDTHYENGDEGSY